jgi:imidazolonepropionase-like amidohydrolase
VKLVANVLLAVIATAMTATTEAQNLPSRPLADVISVNANIYTGVVDTSSSHAIQRAEAIAVRDGRVEAVGQHDEIMKAERTVD